MKKHPTQYPEYTYIQIKDMVIPHRTAAVGYALRQGKLFEAYAKLHGADLGTASSVRFKQKNFAKLLEKAGKEVLKEQKKVKRLQEVKEQASKEEKPNITTVTLTLMNGKTLELTVTETYDNINVSGKVL